MKLKVFILILTLNFCVFSQSQNKEQEALKSLVKQMTDAQANYQPDILDKIFTADYIEISPLGEVDMREKVLGFYKPEMKPPANKMSVNVEVTDFVIRNYGKFAIIITKFNYTMSSEGKPLPPRSIRATIVCQKEKNNWKIASAQFTGIRPPQTSPKIQ